jgi:hypothetical protein
MALESPIPSPSIAKKSPRKISAGGAASTYEANPTSCAAQIAGGEEAFEENKTKVPCEFCQDPCSIEGLMRHQVSVPLKYRGGKSIWDGASWTTKNAL